MALVVPSDGSTDLQPLNSADVERTIAAQLEMLNLIYKSLYNRRFPAYRRGAASLLNF